MWLPPLDPSQDPRLSSITEGVFRTCSLAASAGTGLPQVSSLMAALQHQWGRGREGGREEGRGEAEEWGGRRSGWLCWSRVGEPGGSLIPRITVGLTTCLIGLPSGRPWGVCVCTGVRVSGGVGCRGLPGMGGPAGSCRHLCLCLWVPVGLGTLSCMCVYLGESPCLTLWACMCMHDCVSALADLPMPCV